MDNVIVCVVQQKMRLPADLADFEHELRRFLRVAQAKGAQLIIFPELAGMMAAPPLLNSLRAGLLKQADRGRQNRAGFWERARSKMASGTAGLLGSVCTPWTAPMVVFVMWRRCLGRKARCSGSSHGW